MFKTLVVLVGAMVVAANWVNGEIVEIPLPELLGVYPLDEHNATRTTTFELPDVPVLIYGASFRVSGTATVGSVSCEWGGPYAWTMDIYASMQDTSFAHVWLASAAMPQDPGPFAWTAEFWRTPPTTTWGFLMDGEADLSLTGGPLPLVDLCWPVSEFPRATVVEAVLIVDAEFPVPVEATSWGRIKALYDAP
jgi:hypothetical protein